MSETFEYFELLRYVVARAVKGRKSHKKWTVFTDYSDERGRSVLLNSLYFLDFFCNWLLIKVISFFSVLPFGAPNLTMQCAQIQINHHYVGLRTGHDFHPQFPSFATCSKVCAGESEKKWNLACWQMVPLSIKITSTLCVVLSLFP